MKNIMELDGFTAVICYDPETNRFRGEIKGINGGADFYGANPDELRSEFRASLDFFIDTCKKHGLPVKKPASSGKFVVRLPSDLHAQAATAALAKGLSMNAFIEKAIRHEIQS